MSRPSPPEPAVFPTDPPLRGLAALAYATQRFYIGGVPVARLVSIALLLAAAIWAVGSLPGRWWVAIAWLLLFLALIVVGIQQRRRAYVSFSPSAGPASSGSPLTTQEKLPIRATGLFGVEGRLQRFTMLPGFYRTFATGEHALLCQARPRQWMFFGEWLADEVGMWYVFIPPDAIDELQWGTLSFGSTHTHALALSYRLTIPPQGRRKREEVWDERLYIAFDEPEIGGRIYTDLLHHLPAESPLATQLKVTP